MKEAKIVNGNPDKTYKPENDINRAEFVALAMRAYGTFLVATVAKDNEFVMGRACGKDNKDKCFDGATSPPV